MATPIKSKVVASKNLEKPILVAKNDFSENKEYGMSDTLTANGGHSDNGSFLEINQRAKLFGKNIFDPNSNYTYPID